MTIQFSRLFAGLLMVKGIAATLAIIALAVT